MAFEDIFALKPDGPTYLCSKALGTVRNRTREEMTPEGPEYLFRSDGSASIDASEHFERVIDEETLVDILGGTAADAVAPIEEGEHDDILGVLRFAEQSHDTRATVLEAIETRASYVAAVEADDQSVPGELLAALQQ